VQELRHTVINTELRAQELSLLSLDAHHFMLICRIHGFSLHIPH